MLRPHLKLLSSTAKVALANDLLFVDIPMHKSNKLWQYAIATACYRQTDGIEA